MKKVMPAMNNFLEVEALITRKINYPTFFRKRFLKSKKMVAEVNHLRSGELS